MGRTKRLVMAVVCSAHAEVIPRSNCLMPSSACLLRTRGGDPLFPSLCLIQWESAPHTRR